MLRFFEKRSVADVGSALGVSEDAAGMRISRALEKLRSFFSRRRVTVSTAAIGALMLHHGVQAAPAHLQAAIAGHTARIAGASAGAYGAAPLVRGALRMMFWGKVRVAAVVLVTLTMAGGGGTYLFHYLLTHATPAAPPHHVQAPSEESSV
jgi:hypothetical protein